MSILNVQSLSVDYGKKRPVHAVRNVTLEIRDHEFVGLVGESGCGKSTLGFALAQLHVGAARIVGGEVWVNGECWTRLDPDSIREKRWDKLSVVLQSGMNALNPVMLIRKQFKDVMKQHRHSSSREIAQRSREVLQMVNISQDVLNRYPHELSGGMRQRVVIAMALLLRPTLILMDEPTTALDMVVQRQIVENLKLLRDEASFSLIFISHDLGLVLELVDRVVVMYAGEIVEDRPASEVLEDARHPYTKALIAAMPDPEEMDADIASIPGSPPDLHAVPDSCMFAPRCKYAESQCRQEHPQVTLIPNRSSGRVRCFIAGREDTRNG